ncbi:MAG: ABC transporter permease [Parafilimonas sp.]|nr:ABC transporter permease [Parafilimonas sp.]
MATTIPSTSIVLKSLLRADLKTQWRNRRAVILSLLIPVVILYTWKPLITEHMMAGTAALSSCTTIGLMAIGLMGYTNSIARDRDKGIFLRLRVAPLPAWTIMISRLFVQLVMILLVTIFVLIAGYSFDNIILPATGYLLAFIAAIVGASVYLALGQVIVGLIKNPEIVNATTRLVYFVFVMTGMLGQFAPIWEVVKNCIKWSPYGTVQTILSASMDPSKWTSTTTQALLATIGYAAVLATIGIKKFQWSAK